MQAGTHTLSSRAGRAEALFASALQRSDKPSTEQVRHAVIAAVGALGSRGCAEQVAQEFGDHPEIAAPRMRWALTLASEAFTTPSSPATRRRPAAPAYGS